MKNKEFVKERMHNETDVVSKFIILTYNEMTTLVRHSTQAPKTPYRFRKFKRLGFEKKIADFHVSNRFVNIVYLLSRSVSLYPNKKYVTDR